MQPVGRLFGVDAVLFTTIHEWTKTTIAAQASNGRIYAALCKNGRNPVSPERNGDL